MKFNLDWWQRTRDSESMYFGGLPAAAKIANMSGLSYDEAMDQFKACFLLEKMADSRGSVNRTAASIKRSRDTTRRILQEVGVDVEQARELCRGRV